MSPTKPPQTLYTLCLNEVVSIVIKTCENIESYFGNFDEERCCKSVQYLQDFFLNNVPVTVFDDVYQQWKHTSCNSLMSRNDTRINYAFFLHRHLKRFHAQKRPTFNMLQEPIHSFWVKHLSKLAYITELNLDFVCTDSILRIIVENCLCLLRINIRSGKPINGNWKKNVTDIGLIYLSQCLSLREIRMDSKEMLATQKLRTTTNEGIRCLVSNLPNLLYINYNDMGTILNHELQGKVELPIRKIEQDNCRIEDVKNILGVCPHLQILSLWTSDIDSSERTCILETLTKSKVKLVNITLGDFVFDQVMRDFLEIKGNNLLKLNLVLKKVPSLFEESDEENLQLEDVLHIGICCGKLKSLNLNANISKRGHSPRVARKIFTKLESLTVCGRWHKNLLPMMLKNSTYIKHIFMDGCYETLHDGEDSSFNTMFYNLLAEVPVGNLVKMIVMQKIRFSTESVNLKTIRHLVHQCPNLRIVCLNMLIDGGYTGQMNYEVKQKNLDLKLVFDTNNYQLHGY